MRSTTRTLRLPIAAALLAAAAGCGRAASPAPAPSAPDVLAAVAGEWEGELEYADYRSGRRVRLPTRLVATRLPADSGRAGALRLDFTYTEPNGTTVRGSSEHAADLAGARYRIGGDTLRIAVLEGFAAAARRGRLVLVGTAVENDAPVPARQTLVVTADSLRLLKETREPLAFRNEYRLSRRRTAP